MDRAYGKCWLVLSALCLSVTGINAEEELRKKALELNNVTGASVLEGQVRLLLKDKETSKKLVVEAAKMAQEKPQPFNYNAAFVLGKVAQVHKDIDSAKALYQVCAEQAKTLKSESKLMQVYDSLIDLFYVNKKFDEAIKACSEFLNLPSEDPNSQLERIKPLIMERMIQSKAMSGQIDEALKMTNDLIEANNDGWYFYQLKGFVLREANKLEEAAQAYEKVIEKIDQNKAIPKERRDNLADGYRYLLSGLYVDLKQINKAAEQLQTLLKHRPESATFHNDLGFIWADNDMNLDESEKLIRKALELDRKERKQISDLTPEEDKDNAAYLDSLGWVLYKKKEYKEAKKYLLEASKQEEGRHIEIFDHLADVHMALGEKEEAIQVWKKALELPDISKRDIERRKKVEEKLKKAQE